MTLHEAIEKLLREKGSPMTTAEITEALNDNGWFTKKDGSEICEFQVHGRTHSFPRLFHRDGSKVTLK
ncbi:MAG: HTH domain-containing protein [Bacteroides sp.]|nr:HTH domain-containing protein [Bacteroides sp.]